RRPSSRFVAEFVGENNLFSGSVTEIDEHTITISVGSTSFTIDNDDTPQLTQNDTIVFSVRPEDITKEHPSNTFQATINNIEFLGEAYRIHAEWNDYSLTIRMKESPSSPVTVGFDPADAHIIGH
ncbi:MAG: TOBE domain-containing protein, partial [Halobacteriaceae archaeon]